MHEESSIKKTLVKCWLILILISSGLLPFQHSLSAFSTQHLLSSCLLARSNQLGHFKAVLHYGNTWYHITILLNVESSPNLDNSESVDTHSLTRKHTQQLEDNLWKQLVAIPQTPTSILLPYTDLGYDSSLCLDPLADNLLPGLPAAPVRGCGRGVGPGGGAG